MAERVPAHSNAKKAKNNTIADSVSRLDAAASATVEEVYEVPVFSIKHDIAVSYDDVIWTPCDSASDNEDVDFLEL